MAVWYVPAVLRRFLGLLGATGLVVAQPLLDLLGNAPATFDQYRFEGRSILVFATLVVLVPPIVLGVVVELIRRADSRSGDVAHHLVIGVLLGGFGILLAKSASDLTVLNLVIGVAIGVGGGILHHRFQGMRSWLMLLAAANIMFFVQFGFWSPVAKRIEAATATQELSAPIRLPVASDSAADEGSDTDDAGTDDEPAALPSVYMLILDELPTQTLLTDDGVIDPLRYPTLAAFAEDATFYRRHTTAANFTHSAVPGMLDGRDPFGSPVWVDHPENLFSTLAFSHHLVVSEVLTRLCGFEGCETLEPPPPPSTTLLPPTSSSATGSTVAPDTTTTTTTTTKPVEAEAEPSRDWGGLLSVSWDVWTDRLHPAPAGDAEGFDQFEEGLDAESTTGASTTTSTTTTTTTTLAPSTTMTIAPTGSVVPLPEPSLAPDDDEADRRLGMPLSSQPSRLTDFLAAIRPSDDPIFGYLHLVLPHFPWFLREDGTQYHSPRHSPIAQSGWEMQVLRQRHILQTQYTDRVIGEFLDHLTEQGLYDDAMIILVGDHGMGFAPDTDPRSFTPENLAAVAYTPLLIKSPGQSIGVVSDENLTTTDLTPTIAALLNIGLPWETDGDAAGSAAVADRDSIKVTNQYTVTEGAPLVRTIEFDDDEEYARLMAGVPSPLEPGQDPVTSLYTGLPGAELIGRNADEIWEESATITARVDGLSGLTAPGDEVLPGEISGRVPDASEDVMAIVAVNDEIVGVSPLFESGGTDNQFLVLLPANALRTDVNTVRVGLLDAAGDLVEVPIR